MIQCNNTMFNEIMDNAIDCINTVKSIWALIQVPFLKCSTIAMEKGVFILLL